MTADRVLAGQLVRFPVRRTVQEMWGEPRISTVVRAVSEVRRGSQRVWQIVPASGEVSPLKISVVFVTRSLGTIV